MSISEFCKAHHISIWAASRLGPNRWRIIVQWTDGSKHQMTLTVRSAERPEACAVLRALIHQARAFEANPQEHLSFWEAQMKLARFLGDELYAVAMDCEE